MMMIGERIKRVEQYIEKERTEGSQNNNNNNNNNKKTKKKEGNRKD
jgi:hypothetical protein